MSIKIISLSAISMIHSNYRYIEFLICVLTICCNCEEVQRIPDILLPYNGEHRPARHHRVVRETQPNNYGNITYEEYPPDISSSLDDTTNIVDHKTFVFSYEEYWQKSFVTGHHIVVSDPAQTVSVLEPGGDGGCEKQASATVEQTAKIKNCFVAVNAGFYNTTSEGCLGDVVSDGRYVHDSEGSQNAHFGIEKDGTLFFGYIPDDAVITDNFNQLVGGVIWLVRDGINYVDVSQMVESADSQTTGSLQYFVDVQSARNAVGHDKDGRLVIVAVDGHTGERGVSLKLFADLLIDLGVVNAINLDGGGSVTVVMNDSLVNYPGDKCNISNFLYSCERRVSTVLCVHDIPCDPGDCSNHGDCYRGHCHCNGYWTGTSCDTLMCGTKNCSGHGVCTEEGCDCDSGYVGPECSDSCQLGYYGDGCNNECRCAHNELCSHDDGKCYCLAGYHGYNCESECGYGQYGEQCLGVCSCVDGCSCDPVTGQCHSTVSYTDTWQVGHCMADKIIVRKGLKTMDNEQYFVLIALLVGVVIIALGSIILNVILLSCGGDTNSAKSHVWQRSGEQPVEHKFQTVLSSSENKSGTDSYHDSDADVESVASDGEHKTIFARLPFRSKKKTQSDELWQKWHRKFHEKKHGEPLDSENMLEMQQSNNVTDIIPRANNHYSKSSSDSRPTCTSQNDRSPSVNTVDILEEISLELSSSELPTANGVQPKSSTSPVQSAGSVSSRLTSESFYGSARQSDQ